METPLHLESESPVAIFFFLTCGHLLCGDLPEEYMVLQSGQCIVGFFFNLILLGAGIWG